MRPLFAAILLASCTPAGSDPTDTGDDPVDTGDDTGGGDTDDTDLPSDSTDVDLVRGLIAGEGDVDEVLRAVAWSDGFPVVTSSGKRLFVLATDQTIEHSPFVSGRKASGPSRVNRCHAVCSCARSVRTLATIARSP